MSASSRSFAAQPSYSSSDIRSSSYDTSSRSTSISAASQSEYEASDTHGRFTELQVRARKLLHDAQRLTDACYIEDSLGMQFDTEVAKYSCIRDPSQRFDKLVSSWQHESSPLYLNGRPIWPRFSMQYCLVEDTAHLIQSLVTLVTNDRYIVNWHAFTKICDDIYKLGKWITMVLPKRNVSGQLDSLTTRVKALCERLRQHIPEQKLHYTKKGYPKGQVLITDLKAYREHFQSEKSNRSALTKHLLDETAWYLKHLDEVASDLGDIYRDLRILILRDLANIKRVHGSSSVQKELDSILYGSIQPLYILNWTLKHKERQLDPFAGVSDSERESDRIRSGVQGRYDRHARKGLNTSVEEHRRDAAAVQSLRQPSTVDRRVADVAFRHVRPRGSHITSSGRIKRRRAAPTPGPDWVDPRSNDFSGLESPSRADTYQRRRLRQFTRSPRAPVVDWRIGHL